MSNDPTKAPHRQLVVIGIILAIIGVLVSSYTLNHHLELKQLGQTDSFCNINDTFSCDDVARSDYSEDPYGNPLGVYGIGYFLGLMALLFLSLKNDEKRTESMHAYAILVSLGVISSLSLGAISYFNIGALCISCITVYLICIMQALVLFFHRSLIPSEWSFKSVTNGGMYAFLPLAGTILAFQLLVEKPTPANFTSDDPKSPEEIQNILNKMRDKQEAVENNLPEIPIYRSPYSGPGEDYRKGSDEAKVVIVEFADFECPACGSASRTLRQLYDEFGEQIQVVFKNFPLDQACNKHVTRKLHENACKAAIYSRCAGRHGKFWEMHDKIFDNQRKIDDERLKLWALELGLSQDQIDACLSDDSIVEKIKSDIAEGQKLGVQGTPAIYINERKVSARSIDELRGWVRRFLN